MLTKDDVLKKLEELKPELYQNYSVSKIGLFGSFSDDSFNEESDIDLIVEFEKPVGWSFFSLAIFLEKVFNRKVDLVTINGLKEQLKPNILEQVNYV